MPDSEILIGDCREVLANMEAGSCQMVCTSPPYWGLRDYGTATWEGGDGECEHTTARSRGDDIRPGDKQGTSAGSRPNTQLVCHCGARRIDSQLGLEETPAEFIETMVEVFRGVRRVLRDDGCLWLNMGDKSTTGDPKRMRGNLPQKNLYGMPWRLALALQADGWWLRSDIIWAKPNPMPESCTDRPTKSHEYLFLLTKRATYFYDADAVREKDVTRPQRWISNGGDDRRVPGQAPQSPGMANRKAAGLGAGRNLRTVWTIPTQSFPGAHFATFPERLVLPCVRAGTSERGCCPECGAAWRRVVEKAKPPSSYRARKDAAEDRPGSPMDRGGTHNSGLADDAFYRTTTLGWEPGCKCYDERYRAEFPQARSARKQQQHDAAGSWWRRVRSRPGLPVWPTSPCVVADIFAGACTTGVVCARENRAFIGIELNPKYAAMGEKRIGKAMRLADDDRRQGSFDYE